MDRLYLRPISYRITYVYKPHPHRISPTYHVVFKYIHFTTTTRSAMIFSPSILISFLTLIKSSFSDTVGVKESLPVKGTPYSSINFQEEAPPPPPHSYHPQITRQSASRTSTANASHIQTSSAAPAKSTAASLRGAGDPCGPQGNQTDFESTLNTCGQINTTYTHAPSIYGVQCLNVNPSWNQSIRTTSCVSNIDEMCDLISESKANVSQWTWSSGGPNCTMGIWFNPSPAAQPSLTWSHCYNDIYGLMLTTCFPSDGGQFNVAAVNVKSLPAVGTSGSQVDSGYPSYVIVPETYDDTYMDTYAD